MVLHRVLYIPIGSRDDKPIKDCWFSCKKAAAARIQVLLDQRITDCAWTESSPYEDVLKQTKGRKEKE